MIFEWQAGSEIRIASGGGLCEMAADGCCGCSWQGSRASELAAEMESHLQLHIDEISAHER
jgi:hypothetical protein